jgi:hypothetical protein
VNTFANARCVGLMALFDSTSPEDHAAAAAICAGCPALDACRASVPPAVDWPVGTWAGDLYTASSRQPRRKLADRVCIRCNATFDATASTARYCPPCAVERRRITKHRYDVKRGPGPRRSATKRAAERTKESAA